ncbi:MAG: family 20 glycosylhydrolase, partial [Pirellulales bacterium]
MSDRTKFLGRFALGGCLLICLTAASATSRGAEQPADEGPIEVTWQLLENVADGHFRAKLTLRNPSQTALAPRWKLYFNTAAETTLMKSDAPLRLSHINGDLYALATTKESQPLAPGEAWDVELRGAPWAINVSDAPNGFYLVRSDESGQELAPIVVPRTNGPFPEPVKVRRGGGDQVPVETAASRYAANAGLTELAADALPPVVPTPVEYRRYPGSVTIDTTTAIVSAPTLANEAKQLVEAFESSFGLKLAQQAAPTPGKPSIRLSIGSVQVAGVAKKPGDEAYSLSIAPDRGIEIVGTDAAGVFYGIQTLRGLVPLAAYAAPGGPIQLDAIQIADAPRFGYRGQHLDVARNFQSVETVKRLLDRMAFYKLNRFHWHLTDDEGWRFEVESLPELTKVGGQRGHTQTESDRLVPSYGSGPAVENTGSGGSGFYSRDEFIDVLRYAKARHILVIPEIDVPGHSRAAVKAMAERARHAGPGERDLRLTDPNDRSTYKSVQSWNDNVIDVGRDAAYEFLDIVIGELAAMYHEADARFEIVHLGGDEVPRGAWEGSPACQAIPVGNAELTRGQQLEVYFLKRACKIVAKHGARPAAWDDCLLFAIDDQDWPERPIAYVWNSVLGWGREDAAYRLANAGFDVVLSNAPFLYFDLAYEKDPLDNGYYWAGFVGNRAPFDFNPFDALRDARANSMGQPLAADQFAKSARLSAAGQERILGLQGQLWAENLRSADLLDYMAFPRLIALAERAWSAEPEFV